MQRRQAELLLPWTSTGAVLEPSTAFFHLMLYCHFVRLGSEVKRDFVTECTIRYFDLS